MSAIIEASANKYGIIFVDAGKKENLYCLSDLLLLIEVNWVGVLYFDSI